jgi:hypothetical protein
MSNELLKQLYRGFNRRDLEAVLESMHENVTWANGMEGGHVQGRGAVRNYWNRQWALIDPHVEPLRFSASASGAITVEVHQVIRDLGGNVLADQMVRHVFEIADGLVKRFDIHK